MHGENSLFNASFSLIFCQGDGGSPLMCEGQGGFVQAGIVSWGIECGLPDVPGGYVNVSKYVCWIKNIVEKVS